MKALAILDAASRVSEAAEVMTLSADVEIAAIAPGGGLVRACREESNTCVRIVRNGRFGTGSVSGSEGSPALIDQAISLSRIGPEASFHFPGKCPFQPVDIAHRQSSSIGLEDLTGLLLGVEEELAALWPRSAARGSISRRTIDVCLANTSGFEGEYSKTVLEIALVITFAGPDGLTVRHSRFVTGLPVGDPSRIVDGLMPCPPEARKVRPPSKPVPAVLSPRVLGTLLQTIRSQAAGWTRERGFSGIPAGQRVGSDTFTLHDRPRLPFGGASAPFDAEGVATSDRCLVEKGVFSEHVHDLASAAACGTSSTGSAGVNPGEMPVPVCTNLALETGPGDLAGLMAGADGGVLVAELLPGGSGNVLEGVFRIPVAAAFSISGGRAAAPLRAGCCLEGNALDLFRRISDVEDTLYGVGTDRLPHVIVDGLTLGTT